MMDLTDRRGFLTRAGAWGASVACAAAVARAESPWDYERRAGALVTGEAQRAINHGLSYLAGRQADDGSFGSTGYSRNVSVCGLAGLAFMSAGSTPDRGPYGEHVSRCVGHVLENTSDSGFIATPGGGAHGPMYGHGFATLFLAEVYGMSMRSDVREHLVKAVRKIINTQNEEGGWRYEPKKVVEADISVTICQVMALRAARNAGIGVPNATIDACIDYVKRSQNPDGGFMYRLHGGPSAFPRTAAGVVALYSAGIYDGPEIEKGLDYLERHMPQGGRQVHDSHYFYGQYYAAQAMWYAGGKRWMKWYPVIRDELLSRQVSDGSWMDQICPEYATAMASIVLQMPNNYLPIFQR